VCSWETQAYFREPEDTGCQWPDPFLLGCVGSSPTSASLCALHRTVHVYQHGLVRSRQLPLERTVAIYLDYNNLFDHHTLPPDPCPPVPLPRAHSEDTTYILNPRPQRLWEDSSGDAGMLSCDNIHGQNMRLMLLGWLQFGSGEVRQTHTSQTPTTVLTHLPGATRAGSSKFRSENDEDTSTRVALQLIDTPGHGKLRHQGLDILSNQATNPLKGIIFVVDAAALSTSEALTAAAEYLHDVLLLLQKRYTTAKTSKVGADLPVLIAANKLDLFTALPAPLVKRELEKEISKVRETRAKGLRPAGEKEEEEEEREWLGEGGDSEFRFGNMEEVNVKVDVHGGNVTGSDGSDVTEWWAWIAEQL